MKQNWLGSAIAIVFFSVLVGCQKSPSALIEQAQTALATSDYQRAQDLSESVLALPTVQSHEQWQAEVILLESQARQGKGPQALENIKRLVSEYPSRMNADIVINSGRYLREAKAIDAAIDVLAYGDRQYPADSETFKVQIKALQQDSNTDDDDIAKLKALGYM